MTFTLDQFRKAEEITTDLKQQILYGKVEPDVQTIKNKIVEAQVYIQFALDELEFKNTISAASKRVLGWSHGRMEYDMLMHKPVRMSCDKVDFFTMKHLE